MAGRPKLVPQKNPVEFGLGARSSGPVYVTSDNKRWRWAKCKPCSDLFAKYVNLGSQATCNSCLNVHRAQKRAEKAQESIAGAMMLNMTHTRRPATPGGPACVSNGSQFWQKDVSRTGRSVPAARRWPASLTCLCAHAWPRFGPPRCSRKHVLPVVPPGLTVPPPGTACAGAGEMEEAGAAAAAQATPREPARGAFGCRPAARGPRLCGTGGSAGREIYAHVCFRAQGGAEARRAQRLMASRRAHRAGRTRCARLRGTTH